MSALLEGFSFTHLFTRRGTSSYDEITAYDILRGLDGDFTVYSYRCEGKHMAFIADFQEYEETGELAGVRLEVLSACCSKSFSAWGQGEGYNYYCSGCSRDYKGTHDSWAGALVDLSELTSDYWEELYQPGVTEEALEAWAVELHGAEPLEAILAAQELVFELGAMAQEARYRELAEPAVVKRSEDELTPEALQAFFRKEH